MFVLNIQLILEITIKIDYNKNINTDTQIIKLNMFYCLVYLGA